MFIRRRQWHPTPVLLPGEPHGWRRLVGCSLWDPKESDTTERLQFHFLLSRIGEGNGNPLQCSCLENPRNRGAWWAAVCGVAQSQTQLSDLYFLFSYLFSQDFLKPAAAAAAKLLQLCPTLCDPIDGSPPGSPVPGILQARILEWVAISFFRGSSWPRDRTQVSHNAGRHFNLWATREAPQYRWENKANGFKHTLTHKISVLHKKQTDNLKLCQHAE